MMMDITQDYEYYEAHAKDVKIEDITSDKYNANILARLRDNDPDFTQIRMSIRATRYNESIFYAREGDDLGWLGYFVGNSQELKTLALSIVDSPDNINLNAFFEGLRHNRSINTLDIGADLGESFQSLVPFLKNNNILRRLMFNGFGMGLQCARNIALLIGQQSSLKRLDFDNAEINQEGIAEIARALRSQSQLEELLVSCNSVGRNGYVALGRAFECCLSLRKLDLAALDNDTDDEGLHALADGLKHCHNLTSLDLYGSQMLMEEGSRSLSTLFQSDSCRLEHLDLGEMNIDDNGMAVLATGLANLPTLKRLKLWDTSISDQGIQDLVRALVNCNLEQLILSNNMFFDSVSGLRSLGTLVRRKTNMQSLCLCDGLTDEGLQSFVEGMANCCNLTELHLPRNRLITANGLTSLSPLLRAEHCSLSDLSLYGINFSDDGAVALANGLIGNKSLTKLTFYVSRITARGWAAFARVLCDTSSVSNTYLSNHTLVHIGGYTIEDTPKDIVQHLKLNESLKQAAAICKILNSHSDIDVTPMFEFNLKCLPMAVAWLEKAKSYLDNVNESTYSFKCRQLSAVYKFVRGMPLLVVDGYHSQKTNDTQSDAKKRKRKFDQT